MKVSENDNCHCAGTTSSGSVKVTGRNALKRKAFRRPQKTDRGHVDVTCWDRLLQVRVAATGKAWSLTVDSRVWRTFSDSQDKQMGSLTGRKQERSCSFMVQACCLITDRSKMRIRTQSWLCHHRNLYDVAWLLCSYRAYSCSVKQFPAVKQESIIISSYR